MSTKKTWEKIEMLGILLHSLLPSYLHSQLEILVCTYLDFDPFSNQQDSYYILLELPEYVSTGIFPSVISKVL